MFIFFIILDVIDILLMNLVAYLLALMKLLQQTSCRKKEQVPRHEVQEITSCQTT